MMVQLVRSLLLMCCASTLALCAQAQQGTTQLWVDGTIGKTFASYYKGTLEFGYRTLLSDGSKWESGRIVPRMEVAPTAHWTFLLGVPLVFTEMEAGANLFELRTQLGAKYNFTPFNRVQTRLNLRYEHRSISEQGDGDAQNSNRMRLRAEVAVPLDTRNYRSDTMWYALGDVEAFFTEGAEVDERFAIRTRTRIGLGRKFSYIWRMEAIYTVQQSRNSLSDEDSAVDHIIRLRFMYYFAPRSRKAELEHHAN